VVSLGARLQPTVDRTVEEQKPFHDGHVVVEMRGVSLELVIVVGGEKASGPATVIVQRDTLAGVLAKVVGTPVTVFLETVLLLKMRKTSSPDLNGTRKRFSTNHFALPPANSRRHR